jgi:hypothetical protein
MRTSERSSPGLVGRRRFLLGAAGGVAGAILAGSAGRPEAEPSLGATSSRHGSGHGSRSLVSA